MTVEELDILVQANIEGAVKEFQKLVPTIKSQVNKITEQFNKSDFNGFTGKVKQAIGQVKQKVAELKKSNNSNNIEIKATTQDASKQISQLQKQIESLQEKINARQLKLRVITPRLDEITTQTTKEFTPTGLNANNPAVQKVIDNNLNNNKEYSLLIAQEEKMTQEISVYNKQLNEAKNKMSQLRQEAEQTGTSQNKLASFFSSFKGKLDQAKESVGGFANNFNQMPKITQGITKNIKEMGNNLKVGLSHILRYVVALFSLRGIYSVLSSSAQSWLSSQNSGAQQLSANIEYMKYAMGSALAPVIQFVTNLVFQLMKAIQSVAYALTGVNIFAKATASSMKSVAGSAKKANKETKQLAGVHSEINNVQTQDNSDNSGSGAVAPSFDLSGVDSQLSPLAQKLYDFFKPLKESWDAYGSGLVEQVKTTAGQVGGLIASVWGSFEKIITNGTVYSVLENILAIIGNIAQAFANAWNYNGNGDAIVQNLANAFNNLLTAINNVVQSPGFQEWLNWCSDTFREISEKIASINWQPLINALMQIGTSVGTVAINILSALVDIFKWLVEHPIVAEILLAIAIAIGVVSTAISVISTAMTIWSTVSAVLTAVQTALNIALAPLIGIIVAIIAVIALIVLAIMNWDSITKALADAWEWIKEKAVEIWNAIADFFKNLWQGICDVATNIWNGIKDFFSNIWNGIKNIASTVFNAVASFFSNIWNGIKNVISTVWNAITGTISNVINGIKNTISNVLNSISTIWSNIWNGIKSVVTNIWNGIWGAIKGVINAILSGIESFVNGIIRGINFVLGGISKVANAVGSLLGLNPINLQLNTISLPRLAKGGVLYEETAFIGGEYSGASNNPEIITPQNIMYDTMREAIEDSQFFDNSNGQPINLTINVGNKKLGQILLEDLRDRKRQTGKDIEALVGG